MIGEIKKNIWGMNFSIFGSSVYFVKAGGKNIIIDTSSLPNRFALKRDLESIGIPLEKVDIILMTHKHFDHDGNISIFKNAKVYGDKKDFKSDKILDLEKFKMKEFEIIKVPGHTKGSVVFYMPKEKVLFSGDHIFDNGYIGRTDLPGSLPDEMKASLEKMKKIDYEILCSGHSY